MCWKLAAQIHRLRCWRSSRWFLGCTEFPTLSDLLSLLGCFARSHAWYVTMLNLLLVSILFGRHKTYLVSGFSSTWLASMVSNNTPETNPSLHLCLHHPAVSLAASGEAQVRPFASTTPLCGLLGGAFPHPRAVIQRSTPAVLLDRPLPVGCSVVLGAAGWESLVFALHWRPSAPKAVPRIHVTARPRWQDAVQTARYRSSKGANGLQGLDSELMRHSHAAAFSAFCERTRPVAGRCSLWAWWE